MSASNSDKPTGLLAKNLRGTAFWNFSVSLYSTPGIADVCLALQDEHDIDVNLLLLCLWYGKVRGQLNHQQFADLLDYSRTWSGKVVKPLRRVRRWLKAELQSPDSNSTGQRRSDQLVQLRNRLKALELEAEKLQQQRLEEMLDGPLTGSPAAGRENMRYNLDLYLQALSIPRTDKVNQQLDSLLHGALAIHSQP